MRIYIDMDGVITDFKKGQEYQGYKLSKRPDLVVNYRTLPVMEGAIEALAELNADHEIFIASTPPWTRPEVWGHKREWLEEHFPYLKRRLILTHRKDLLIGDVLLDSEVNQISKVIGSGLIKTGTIETGLHVQNILKT